ncbi:DUF294 nucleotidyltransferase-like domain-containing protein [Conchiformibius steedae DSM 2580]|uniref:DUF294 nucleotidyltransferase-like domain-containing protein n=1 Tax=Conchiformibius steedae DSM 2580 TaxID=1121352 RepID=A0AAE9HY57_9NEIS|nr:DUF294 nucleotidyltransferase-like domain-containing protein [Conchiformibius steedae]QMT33846.1 cyclic nucleotide-binding domain-containing protein [Conchiformibius steedae]URD68507.1 DUF294 nucleotidyltransferase-like domain-containing protein [Conchiformibius steedae DSM 2580]
MQAFDFSCAPFSYLSPQERLRVQQSINIAYYNNHETIIAAKAPIEFLYVVLKGLVRETGNDGEVLSLYHPHDTFEARGLLEGSCEYPFIAEEQTLVYTIPKAVIQEIIAANPRFAAYCYASVADKFASLAQIKNESEFESLFTAKVRDAYHPDPAWLDGDASVLDAAQTMKTRKTKSLLVRHQDKVGVLTESFFRDMLINGTPADTRVGDVATYALISTDIDDFVFTALLQMMRHRIQRVVVTEQGKPVGTLEQIDVLAYFSNHSHLIAQRLDRASDIDELVELANQMTRSIQLLRNNGVRAPQLAQLMQVLNTGLFEKVWRIIAPEALYRESCLIVMGSEGRGEQILKTDQDNALIIRRAEDAEMAQAAAEQFSATLARLGYPPCAGNIMVSNPDWRKPLPEFKDTVLGWCRSPSPAAMMNLAIFIDAKVVAGDATLLSEVKDHLYRHMVNDAGMLMGFARAVEQFDSHSHGFFAQLLHRQPERLDIKKMGQFPIVHGIRALSLEARLEETNTFERIHKLVQLNVLNESLGRDIAEALGYLMDLRLKANLAIFSGQTQHQPNQLDFKDLSTLERDLLKDALAVVKRFKGVIRHHFHLNA